MRPPRATCIDPLDTIDEHGADTMRLALLVGNAPGKDLKLGPERIVGCKRLINKIWNAAKLVLITAGERDLGSLVVPDEIEHPMNRWMLARRRELVERVTSRLEESRIGDAAEQIHSTFWGEYCDVYLEAIKVDELSSLDETVAVAVDAFCTFLALWHPFMPFVTEALWSELGGGIGCCFLAEGLDSPWPRVMGSREGGIPGSTRPGPGQTPVRAVLVALVEDVTGLRSVEGADGQRGRTRHKAAMRIRRRVPRVGLEAEVRARGRCPGCPGAGGCHGRPVGR